MVRHKPLQTSHAFIVPNSQVDVKKKNDLKSLEKSVDMKESSVYNSPHIYLHTQYRII